VVTKDPDAFIAELWTIARGLLGLIQHYLRVASERN
jgi:hypothetical protein